MFSTSFCEARMPASSSGPPPNWKMSYHARMRMPLLIVTARTGACGKTKRTGLGRRNSGTIGSKSWPSAPRPCSQMTEATGFGPVSISTASISRSVAARMRAMLRPICVGFALSMPLLAAWAQPTTYEPAPLEQPAPTPREMPAKPIEMLRIGTLKGLARPEGFVVEDLRKPEAMAATPFKETYRAPFSPFKRPVPLAKYERQIAEGELSVSPVDLFAEKLIESYGDRLKGKRLTVHEFSYRLEQVINQPQGMNYVVIPGPGLSVATAVALSAIGSAAGTAMLQGKGIDLRLHVKIDAELDGKRIEAKEDPMNIGADGPARNTRYAIEKFQYRYDPPSPEPESAEAKPEEKADEPKKD